LKSDDLAGTFRRNPKVGTMLFGKSEKHIGSSFNTLILGSGIQKEPVFSGGIRKEGKNMGNKDNYGQVNEVHPPYPSWNQALAQA
jgi:hypothetical protein